jgi:hypothetical protein
LGFLKNRRLERSYFEILLAAGGGELSKLGFQGQSANPPTNPPRAPIVWAERTGSPISPRLKVGNRKPPLTCS